MRGHHDELQVGTAIAKFLKKLEPLHVRQHHVEQRDIGLLASNADRRVLAHGDLEGPLERLTRAYDGERSMRAYGAVDQALAALERNASPKVVADWLVLRL